MPHNNICYFDYIYCYEALCIMKCIMKYFIWIGKNYNSQCSLWSKGQLAYN